MDKTFNAQEAEALIMAAWEATGAFKAGANWDGEKPSFSILIPPPNVTGSLHIGHAFNNTLQDVLIRWKRMQGYDVLWQPGTDHAGIATQMVTEREMAKVTDMTRQEMGREKFLERVWAQKSKSRGMIIGQLKRLGCSCDWSREAFTMGGAPGDPEPTPQNFHDAVIKVFVEMYENGLIYRGKRLVNWDPHFETAISDLEVENIEVPGHMWHFKYPLAGGATYEYVEKDDNGNEVLRETRDYISIATTRPETMLGDGAVAVHPSDERYAPIVGQLCEIPVGPKEHRRLIPIITDDYPDPTFGSGAVKITGAHDFNDYGVAQRNGIPMYRLMDTKAQMRAPNDGAPYEEAAAIAQEVAQGQRTLTEAETDALNLVPDHLRGLDRFEARKRVVDEITAEGLAVMMDGDDGPVPFVEAKAIMQPFGDRSKVVIEPMLTDQWFVDAEKLAGPALEAVRSGRVKILPESGEKTFYHWLENIEPWCISRQLWWGHQIPVWYAFAFPEENDWIAVEEGLPAIGEAKNISGSVKTKISGDFTFEAIENFNSAKEKLSGRLSELNWPFDIAHTEFALFEDENEGWDALVYSLQQKSEGLRDSVVYPIWRDPDVLDTWFSSGLWPIGTLGWPEDTDELKRYFPTSVLVTGQDILFFWVARMMMMQLAVVDEIPFHEVYLHGLVRDAKGKKMSKSVGNVVDPLEVIDELGADALRFSSAAMAALGGVLKLDMERIKGYRNFGTKLWNAVRFAEMNHAVGPDKPQQDRPTPQATVNRWIIGETARTREVVDAALADYRFNDAANALYAFVWGKVCDWYLEFSKPLLQGEDAALQEETRQTLAWVLDQCLILLHPIMPFITEELWGESAQRDKMLIHAAWPDYTIDLIDAEADAEMTWVIAFIEAIRSARAQMNVPVGTYIPVIALNTRATAQAAYAKNKTLIDRLARISALSPADAAPKGAIAVVVGGDEFALPLADVIDVAKERGRLEKNLSKLDKEIKGLEGRVNNPKFVSSAPQDVVEEAQANLAQRKAEAEAVQAALSRLAELGY